MSSHVGGFVADGFEKIKESFQEIITQAPESGAALYLAQRDKRS